MVAGRALFMAVTINHLAEQALRRSLLSDDEQREGAIALYHSLAKLVRYAIVLATIACLAHLVGAFSPLYNLISQPVITLENQNVSVLVLVKAAVIVVLFGLSARLIRDYLRVQYLPAAQHRSRRRQRD